MRLALIGLHVSAGCAARDVVANMLYRVAEQSSLEQQPLQERCSVPAELVRVSNVRTHPLDINRYSVADTFSDSKCADISADCVALSNLRRIEWALLLRLLLRLSSSIAVVFSSEFVAFDLVDTF